MPPGHWFLDSLIPCGEASEKPPLLDPGSWTLGPGLRILTLDPGPGAPGGKREERGERNEAPQTAPNEAPSLEKEAKKLPKSTLDSLFSNFVYQRILVQGAQHCRFLDSLWRGF